MNTFIKKHEYNYIKRCLRDLKNSFKGCMDNDIIAASKIYIQDKIFSVFSSLSEDEKALLDITNLTKSTEVDEPVRKLFIAYKSIGFDICLDSNKCNERIESVEKLEKILKEVNDTSYTFSSFPP